MAQHSLTKPGSRFGVYNGDAKGTLLTANSQEVTYRFDHELETVHTHSASWYRDHTFKLEESNA